MRIDNFMVLGKDNDSIPRPHQFSEMDMRYIKEMNLISYELYDLIKDRGQKNNVFPQHPDKALYERTINNQLKAIQVTGYYWKNLSESNSKKKIKTEWVKYNSTE